MLAAFAGPTAAELEGYSRRQRAYLGADPDKYKHFKPRLSRRERGSFADASVAAEFEEEVGRSLGEPSALRACTDRAEQPSKRPALWSRC